MTTGTIEFDEMALRIVAATVAGLLLGLDREARGFPAGLRTTALVSLSSAAITVSALMLYSDLAAEGQPGVDPLRVVQGLAQAIGFIAAGVILTSGEKVHHLTTAANLWLAAAVGIACGAAQYELAALAVGLGILLLAGMRLLERLIPGSGKFEEE